MGGLMVVKLYWKFVEDMTKKNNEREGVGDMSLFHCYYLFAGNLLQVEIMLLQNRSNSEYKEIKLYKLVEFKMVFFYGNYLANVN